MFSRLPSFTCSDEDAMMKKLKMRSSHGAEGSKKGPKKAIKFGAGGAGLGASSLGTGAFVLNGGGSIPGFNAGPVSFSGADIRFRNGLNG